MGSFLSYLNKVEKELLSKNKKQNRVDDIDLVEEDVYEEEVYEEEDSAEEYEEESNIDTNIFKRRLVNELNNIGLNNNKINEIIYNVFNENVYEESNVKQYQSNQPKRRGGSFKERMSALQQKNYVESPRYTVERADEILNGVSEMNQSYNIPTNVPVNQYQPMQNSMPVNKFGPSGPPPPMQFGPMMSVNDSKLGSIAAAAPQQMISMPEGYENFKVKHDNSIPIEHQVKAAVNILDEPTGPLPMQPNVSQQPVPVNMLLQQPVNHQTLDVNNMNTVDHASALL